MIHYFESLTTWFHSICSLNSKDLIQTLEKFLQDTDCLPQIFYMDLDKKIPGCPYSLRMIYQTATHEAAVGGVIFLKVDHMVEDPKKCVATCLTANLPIASEVWEAGPLPFQQHFPDIVQCYKPGTWQKCCLKYRRTKEGKHVSVTSNLFQQSKSKSMITFAAFPWRQSRDDRDWNGNHGVSVTGELVTSYP